MGTLRNSLSTLAISIHHIDVIHLEPGRDHIDSSTLVQTTRLGRGNSMRDSHSVILVRARVRGLAVQGQSTGIVDGKLLRIRTTGDIDAGRGSGRAQGSQCSTNGRVLATRTDGETA